MNCRRRKRNLSAFARVHLRQPILARLFGGLRSRSFAILPSFVPLFLSRIDNRAPGDERREISAAPISTAFARSSPYFSPRNRLSECDPATEWRRFSFPVTCENELRRRKDDQSRPVISRPATVKENARSPRFILKNIAGMVGLRVPSNSTRLEFQFSGEM